MNNRKVTQNDKVEGLARIARFAVRLKMNDQNYSKSAAEVGLKLCTTLQGRGDMEIVELLLDMVRSLQSRTILEETYFVSDFLGVSHISTSNL